MRSEGERWLERDTDKRKQKKNVSVQIQAHIYSSSENPPKFQITERCHTPPWLATLLLWQPKQGLHQGEFRGNHRDCSADLNDIAALPQTDEASVKVWEVITVNRGQMTHNCNDSHC